MVEPPGMKPACCIRLRDLIAETDLRRRMNARSFPGIDKRVIIGGLRRLGGRLCASRMGG